MQKIVFVIIGCAFLRAQELYYWQPKMQHIIEVDYKFQPLSVQLDFLLTSTRSAQLLIEKFEQEKARMIALTRLRNWQIVSSGEQTKITHKTKGFEVAHSFAAFSFKKQCFLSKNSTITTPWTRQVGLLDASFCAETCLEVLSENQLHIEMRFFFDDYRTRNDFRALGVAPLLLTYYREELLFWLHFLSL